MNLKVLLELYVCRRQGGRQPEELTSFKPVRAFYVQPGWGRDGRAEEREASAAAAGSSGSAVAVPASDLVAVARSGGSLRAPSAAPLYRDVAFDVFPPSGVVMVRMEHQPREPWWPGRIVSHKEYEVFYRDVPFANQPTKKVK